MSQRSDQHADHDGPRSTGGEAVPRPPKLRDSAVIGFGLTLAVLLVGGVLGYVNVGRLDEDRRWVGHTHEVIGALETLLSTLKDAETGQRGYLLAEDEKYLEPYDDALKRVGAELAKLKELTSDNADQQARLAVLKKKIDVRLDELKRTVALTKAGDRPAALKVVRSDTGKAVMDDVRRDIAAMQRVEDDWLKKRAEDAETSFRITVLSVLLPAIIGVVLVGVVYSLSRRNLVKRQRAAEVLAEQKERLRTTLACIGDAVITTDTAGRITNMNAVAEALTGWRNGEAAGQPLDAVFRIVNETTRKAVENPATRALREGVIVGLANHTVLIAKGGTERPIDDSAAPIRCKAGEVVGCVLVFRDITERKRVESEREEAQRQTATTLESITDGFTRFDRDWRVVYVNDAAERINQRPRAETLGKTAWELFPALVGTKLEAEYRRCVAEQVTVEFDYHYEPWDRWFALKCYPTPGGGLVAFIRDITDPKRAGEMLRASEERFRALAESIPQLAWTANPDGHIFWYNRRWYDYTGTTFEQMEGWGWQSVHDPAELPQVMERWRASIATGQPFDMVFPLKGMDGVFRRFLTRVVPVKDANDRVVQWFGTNTDIHEQVQTAERLRTLTAELSEADRRKDEFLATLAHELRNPLAPLRNGLQVMRLARGNAEAVEQSRNMMERQLDQMVRLVDDLMDVSRISRGKLELKTERVALAAVVNSAVETSRPLIDQMGHELTVTLPKHPVVIAADLTRLAQVFLNLLNNAAKYSDRGGHIRLAAERQGSDVVVSVKDTGIGIAADQMPHIFKMFSQVDRSLEKSQGGLGIGLTLVRRLVEMHGGSVEARSEGPGKGSEFVVRLPLVVEASVPPKAGREENPSAPESALRILIVDDNRDSADSLSMMLKIMGNDTRTAYDGEEAVAAAGEFRPAVILLDIGLPKLNGYEACRRIREKSWGRELVIIAQTGWGQDEDRQRTHDAGFDHHMVKPVDPTALMKMLAVLSDAARK